MILGLPLIGSQVAQFAVHTTEVFLLSKYSVTALAQGALGAQVFFIAFIFGSGFGWAVLPMVAAALEDNDLVQVRRVTRMGLWLSTIVGVVLFLPMWFSEPWLIMMKQDPEVAAGAQTYLRLAGLGLFPALWVAVLRSYLSAIEHTGVILAVSIGVLILNAVLSYILIFGAFGAPELGLVGAGIAALLVQVVTFVGFVIYIQAVLADQNMFVRFWRADPGAIVDVTRLGVPISITALAESGLFAASAFMMGAIGKLSLASHALVLQFAALTFMIHLGLSQASTVRAGRAHARDDRAALKLTAQASMGVSALVAVIITVLFLTMPQILIGAVIDWSDPDAQAILTLGIMLLMMAAAFQFVDAAQVMALAILRGMQDTKGPMWIATVSYWVVGLPIGYYLAFHTGLREIGVWSGMVVGLALTAILLWWRFLGALRKMV